MVVVIVVVKAVRIVAEVVVAEVVVVKIVVVKVIVVKVLIVKVPLLDDCRAAKHELLDKALLSKTEAMCRSSEPQAEIGGKENRIKQETFLVISIHPK